jgi:hypothetical protein
MSVYFTLILLTRTSEAAKSISAKVSENPDTYLTISDLKDFKILALTLIVISALNLVKFLASFFSSERKDLKDRVEELEEITTKIDHKIDTILLSVAQIKDSQLTESQIRKLTREEIDYVDKLKTRRN